MATPVRDKYYLRSLHEEIGLFDRKLAHLLNFETFSSESDRTAAAGKLSAKREQLVRTARQLAQDGIEFKASELPHSLRPQDEAMADVVSKTEFEEPALQQTAPRPKPMVTTLHDGSPLDYRQELQAYIDKRRKAAAASSKA